MTRRLDLGLLQVAAAGVLWGTGGLVVQLIRREQPLSVLVLSGERMLIGSAAMLGIVLLGRGLRDLRRLGRRHPVAIAAIGCATAAYQALYFLAVTHVGVAVATVVSLGIAPVLLAADAAVRRRAVPPPRELLVLAVALAGLVLVSLPRGDLGPHPTSGVLLALASGTTYAVTTAVGRHVALGSRPTSVAAAAMVVGAVALAPFLVLAPGPVRPDGPVVSAWLAYLGVGTMALAYLALYAGLRTVDASTATLVSLLEPVTAALLAWLVLDERLGPVGVLGVVLVLAAVAGLARVDPEVTRSS